MARQKKPTLTELLRAAEAEKTALLDTIHDLRVQNDTLRREARALQAQCADLDRTREQLRAEWTQFSVLAAEFRMQREELTRTWAMLRNEPYAVPSPSVTESLPYDCYSGLHPR